MRDAAGPDERREAARQRAGFSDFPVLFDVDDRGLLPRVEFGLRGCLKSKGCDGFGAWQAWRCSSVHVNHIPAT